MSILDITQIILLSIAVPSKWKYGRGKIRRPVARSVRVLAVLRDTPWMGGSVIRGLVAIGFTIWSGYGVAYDCSARLNLCPDNADRAFRRRARDTHAKKRP